MAKRELADLELQFGASGPAQNVAVSEEYCENCQGMWQGLICKSCFNVMRCVCCVRTSALPKRREVPTWGLREWTPRVRQPGIERT